MMNKMSIEFKKWYQLHSQSHPDNAGVTFDHPFTAHLLSRATLMQAGQLLAVTLISTSVYLLNLWADDGVRLLVALAATSALSYVGLAIQSRTRLLVLLNLMAVPFIFATAYAGLTVAPAWLILSFILHGCLAALQLSSVDSNLKCGLFCWLVFNVVLALLLMLI